MRIALGLEYDGTPFSGWQSQRNGRGVQDALERALSGIAGETLRVVAAGRTDAGVHASSQVVHFDTEADRPDSAWVRGTNAWLPPAVAVRWSQRVPEAFHARFVATGRHYTYLLLNRPIRSALLRARAGWYHRPLAISDMKRASQMLLGQHDFSAFRAAECQARTPVRTLDRLDVSREGDLLRFDLHADAFLHHMVRNIVGALVYVGNARHPPEWIAGLLAGRDRTRGAPTASPDGLYLAGIDYATHWNLPATRIAVTIPDAPSP